MDIPFLKCHFGYAIVGFPKYHFQNAVVAFLDMPFPIFGYAITKLIFKWIYYFQIFGYAIFKNAIFGHWISHFQNAAVGFPKYHFGNALSKIIVPKYVLESSSL
ncbi:hypothetical protein [Aquimarina algicola]|uniref:Uncharacterized protein n=1 Tax=Aquimarina algicola TaxID=2589995 RepID=A0A504JDZ3_9FLAO|nr:hypothetical protein [Aquimarina algicola]TPN85823.1 hypothetical protein FHK87_11075 [Aquimarina algicola]